MMTMNSEFNGLQCSVLFSSFPSVFVHVLEGMQCRPNEYQGEKRTLAYGRKYDQFKAKYITKD